MSEFSQDIIVDILTRLPVKSVCRFRCVSKTWLRLTHEPHFIETHLSRHQKPKLILSFSQSLFLLDQEAPIDDDMLPSELEFPLKGENNSQCIPMFGSCNGLVCIMPQPRELFIFNPSTQESMRVPDSHLHRPSQSVGVHVHGFGYAPSVKDYVLVNINYDRTVLIFSLKKKFWKRVQDFPYKIFPKDPGMPLNGAVHWFCTGDGNQSPVIAAFNLAEEKFSGIPPPEPIGFSQRCSAGVLRESLCLLHYDLNRQRHHVFWIMKEYGVKESWTKILIKESYFFLQPLCYWKNTKILVARNRSQVLVYNPKDGTCKSLLANGLQVPFIVDVYVESLVSPNSLQE